MFIYQVYGVTFSTEQPFHIPLIPGNEPVDVALHIQPATSIEKARLEQCEPVNLTRVQTPDGLEWVHIFHMDDQYALQFTDYVDFWVSPTSITAYIQQLNDEMTLQMLFLGSVLALWLYQQGRFGLHASSISMHDHALIFSAYNHSGKSSLAASCLLAGYALLADDFAGLHQHNGINEVQPGFPQIKMWEDQAALFFEDTSVLCIAEHHARLP
ncbi:MAG: hypothetical protein P1S60_04415 [Anaerolineae bacterium]|nr:hypothetical protein [Anaerolineae bacterium]